MTERINNSTNHVQGGGAGPSWISKTDFRQQLAAEVASHTGKLMVSMLLSCVTDSFLNFITL